MSERGTVITQYVYCARCLGVAREVLDAELDATADLGAAIAGRISSSFSGGEILCFETEIAPRLQERLCHSLRVAVMADNGFAYFLITEEYMEKTLLPSIERF